MSVRVDGAARYARAAASVSGASPGERTASAAAAAAVAAGRSAPARGYT